MKRLEILFQCYSELEKISIFIGVNEEKLIQEGSQEEDKSKEAGKSKLSLRTWLMK